MRRAARPLDAGILCYLLTLAALVLVTTPALIANEIPLAVSDEYEFLDLKGRNTVILDGGLATVWLSGAFPTQLAMQWVDAAGQPLLDPGGRAIAGLDGVSVADVAIVPRFGGGVFVGFNRFEGFGDANLYVQAFDASGTALWPGEGVRVTEAIDSQGQLTLASDNGGACYACFNEAQTSRVKCQYLDNDGKRLWGPEGLSVRGAAGVQVEPVALPDGLGGLIVLWRNQRDPQDGVTDNLLIEGQRFTPLGTPVWGDGLLVRDTLMPEAFGFTPNILAAVGDGAGGAYVALSGRIDIGSANTDVIAQRISALGTLPWGTGVPVIADTAESRHEATVATPDGIAVLTSEANDPGRRLRAFRLDETGSHLWGSEGISVTDPTDLTRHDFASASFGGNEFRVAWTRDVEGAASSLDVVLARFAQDGSPIGPQPEVINDEDNAQFCRSVLFSSSPPQTFVVWEDFRKGDFDDLDVYAARLPTGLIFADGFESGNTSAWTD